MGSDEACRSGDALKDGLVLELNSGIFQLDVDEINAVEKLTPQVKQLVSIPQVMEGNFEVRCVPQERSWNRDTRRASLRGRVATTGTGGSGKRSKSTTSTRARRGGRRGRATATRAEERRQPKKRSELALAVTWRELLEKCTVNGWPVRKRQMSTSLSLDDSLNRSMQFGKITVENW